MPLLYVNFSVRYPKFAQKWPLSYFQPTLAAIVITIETVNVELIPDLYTLAIILIKLYEEIGKKQFVYISLIGVGGGGQKSLSTHVAL